MDVATPLTVVVVNELVPFANVPLAPEAGAVKVTDTPLSRFPLASFTVATSGAAKAVEVMAVCGVPLVAVMEAGAACEITRVKVAVALSGVGVWESVTVTLTVLLPAAAGVPVI